MLKEQYRRDNDRLHAREDLLMEIEKKAAHSDRRAAFVRYGAAAAVVVLAVAGTVGLALGGGIRGGSPTDAADTSMLMAETASSAADASAAGGGNRVAATPGSYDELYELMTETRRQSMMMDSGMTKEAVAAEAPTAEAPMAREEPASEPAAAAETAAVTRAASADEAGHSETNVQVAGVDEADIVKTDGTYIYYLTDGELVITRANGEKSRVLSKTNYLERYLGENGADSSYWYGVEMYVAGDRLVIVLQGARNMFVRGTDWYTETTGAAVYNIADRANPKFLTTLGQSGSYVSSRLLDGFVYLVTTQYVYRPVQGEPITFAPSFWRDGTAQPMQVSDILIPNRGYTNAYTVVGSFDMAEGTAYASSKAMLGNAGQIYMNASHLLVASSENETKKSDIAPDATGKNVQVTTNESRTQLLLFGVDSGGIEKLAEGTVEGTLLNQFSMDEYDGVFRIVTTVSSWTEKIYTDGVDTYEYEDENSNALITLDADLQPIGAIGNLAKDEWVKSVRFDGEIAYFVTFRQTDPLFTVDLSDPAKPAVLSTLKIPGFSEYLHVYGEGRLLGIGYDADEKTGWTQGVKLSMFDTSDKADVKELTTKVISADWTAAGSNHKAILVSTERALIAFPADDCYYVFTYSDTEGFVQRGKLRQDGGWGDRLRGVFIGENLYVCSNTGITVIALSDASIVHSIQY